MFENQDRNCDLVIATLMITSAACTPFEKSDPELAMNATTSRDLAPGARAYQGQVSDMSWDDAEQLASHPERTLPLPWESGPKLPTSKPFEPASTHHMFGPDSVMVAEPVGGSPQTASVTVEKSPRTPAYRL